MCVGGGLKGCRGKFKRCGLDFGIPIKVQWVYCFFLFCFVFCFLFFFVCFFVCFFFMTKIILFFFFSIGVGCLHAYSKHPNIKKKKKWYFKKKKRGGGQKKKEKQVCVFLFVCFVLFFFPANSPCGDSNPGEVTHLRPEPKETVDVRN